MSLVPVDATSLAQHVPVDHAAILRAFNIDPADPKSQAMILACEKYGLDPLLKHAVLISGNLYVTRDGLLAIAHRSGMLNGIVIEDEGDTDTEWWAKVTVHVKGQDHGYTYRGRYPHTGQLRKYGPEMAVKVAEVMALRRAFGVTGLPVVEEQWDQQATMTNGTQTALAAFDVAVMASADQVARIDELVLVVPADRVGDLREWRTAEAISMKSGEFTEANADRVIAKLEELSEVVRGGEPNPSPSAAVPAVSSGGGELGMAAQAPASGDTSASGEMGAASTPDPAGSLEPGGEPDESVPPPVAPVDGAGPGGPAPSGLVTDIEGELLKVGGKTIPAAKRAVLKHAATKHGFGGTWADLLTDEALCRKVYAELDPDPRRQSRKWMHATWSLNGGADARKTAISLATSGATDSSNDLDDEQWRQFMDSTGKLPNQLEAR